MQTAARGQAAPFATRLNVKATASPAAKLITALVLAGAAAMLIVGASLTPSAEGVGTHEELGFPPCGFLATYQMPCATCGMTTAVSHAAHGHLLMAITTQPAGAAIAVLAMMAVILCTASLLGGFSLAPLGAAIWRPRVVLLAALFVLAAWVYKILLVRGAL
jgi:hypothetical protein